MHDRIFWFTEIKMVEGDRPNDRPKDSKIDRRSIAIILRVSANMIILMDGTTKKAEASS
jgi:hypothetical protein